MGIDGCACIVMLGKTRRDMLKEEVVTTAARRCHHVDVDYECVWI